MVQILPAAPRKPSFSERLSQGVGRGLEMGQQLMQQQQRQQAVKQLGLDPSILQLPEEAQAAYFKQAFTPEKKETLAQQAGRELNEAKLRDIEEKRQMLKSAFPELFPQENETVEKPKTRVPFQIGMEPEEESSRKPKKGLEGMTENQLRTLAANKGQQGTIGILGNEAQAILDKKEKKEKTSEAREAELRKETLPIRTQIAERGELARRGIESKQNALKIIRTGNINDPTFATIMDNLPFKLGQRMLSSETVEYKAGLVDNYSDLRSLFTGATRVKEIEILENKIADIYLTDEQKTRILESRINAHKADVIRAEEAAKMEEEGQFYSIGRYNQELEKRVRPKLDALFNQILNEQESIIKDAENRKKIPLNFNDPDDVQIIEQIFLEAGKNPEKAEELAKKKGYVW